MRQSKEKRLRLTVLARAVKALRGHLEWSQRDLADALADAGSSVDTMTVSRWERGVREPQADNRKALAQFARKHGRLDLAYAFADPARNWKSALQQDRLIAEVVTMLEVTAINLLLVEKRGDMKPDEELHLQALFSIAADIQRLLFLRYGKEQEPVLLDEYQREWWRKMVEEQSYLREKGIINDPPTR